MRKKQYNSENARKNRLLSTLRSAQSVERILLLLVFFLPYLNLLPKPTAWLSFLSAIMFLCFAFSADMRKSIKKTPFEGWLILLLIALFCLSVSRTQPLSSLKSGWTYAILLCSFFPALSAFQNTDFRLRFQNATVFSATVVSAYGVFQYFFTDMELKWVDFSRFSDIGSRVTSVFSNPNILGAYLLLCLPFSLSRLMNCKDVLRKMTTAIATLLILLCLILTWSRGAWLGAIAEVVVFFLFYSRTSRHILFFGAMLSPLSLPLLPQTVLKRFSSIHMEGDSSIRYRMQTWKGVWQMVKNHPFGVGCGELSFSAAYQEYAVKGTETVPHAHHLLMQISCELGWLGACIFLMLCILLVYRGVICCRFCIIEERAVLLTGVSALLGSLVMGLFDHIWYHRGVFWLFWIVIGFGCSILCLHWQGRRTKL